MSNERSTTKPSTAKPGWREATEKVLAEGKSSAKDAIDAFAKHFEDIPDEELDGLPPKTKLAK